MHCEPTPPADLDQVTVVSVTYQSEPVVEAMARTLKPFPHVVVVDNGSSDATVPRLRQLLPGATVIARTRNAGFGAANNQAMQEVTTPFVLLLNPDCEITPATVATLLAALERYPQAGVVSPQTWQSDRAPQMCCRPAFFEPHPGGPYRVPDGICSTRWLRASCLLIRSDAYRQIGGFDERFFLYYEDDDLCLRMQEAGYGCLLEPAANVRHAGGGSSRPSWRTTFRKHFHYALSRHLAIGRYVGRPAARRYLLKTLWGAPLAAPLYLLLLRPHYALKWLAWGCAMWSHVLHPRRDRAA